MRVDLREQEPGLLLDAVDGVLAGDPAQRRLVAVGELDERPGELGRVPGLLTVHGLSGRDRSLAKAAPRRSRTLHSAATAPRRVARRSHQSGAR
jgi:hypothetical protein